MIVPRDYERFNAGRWISTESVGTSGGTRRAHFYTWSCMCEKQPGTRVPGCFASLRSGWGVSLCFALVLMLQKSAAEKAPIGRAAEKPSDREAGRFWVLQGLGPRPQQVFCEWPASCPTCEFRKWGPTLIACSPLWGPASPACQYSEVETTKTWPRCYYFATSYFDRLCA